ncbi:MAG: FeoB-associated Cys-rich membrane protein [Bacillota bacterium]|nr:FeoB-associated Cys-rich membrane protein [Bacillota bacterium]
MLTTIVAVVVLVAVVTGAIAYIVKSKRKGVKCIGCPAGVTCEKCKGAHHEG